MSYLFFAAYLPFLTICVFSLLYINLSDFPCMVALLASVEDLVEPKGFMNFTDFSQGYVNREKQPLSNNFFEPRFGGHQSLEEREKSFSASNQTLHCGFVKGAEGYPSTGFDLNETDKAFMNTCWVVVSSCIFGSSDFLRRPTSKLVTSYFTES